MTRVQFTPFDINNADALRAIRDLLSANSSGVERTAGAACIYTLTDIDDSPDDKKACDAFAAANGYTVDYL